MQYNVGMNIHKQPLKNLRLIDQVHTARKYLDTLAPCTSIHFTEFWFSHFLMPINGGLH